MVYNVWFIVDGLCCCTVYGLCFVIYDLWFMIHGLWFGVQGKIVWVTSLGFWVLEETVGDGGQMKSHLTTTSQKCEAVPRRARI